MARRPRSKTAASDEPAHDIPHALLLLFMGFLTVLIMSLFYSPPAR